MLNASTTLPSLSPIPTSPSCATYVHVKYILSPVKSRNGTYYTEEYYQLAGSAIADYIPSAYPHNTTVINYNGKYIPPQDYSTTFVPCQGEHEIIVRVVWGFWEAVATALIYAAVALVVSIAIQAIMYFAFPTKVPKLRSPREDVSFAWEGIVTTQGPGNVIPVSYGHNKLGGQLLHGYYRTKKTKGGGGVGSGPLFNPNPILHMLLAAGEGEIEFIDEDSIVINNQPIGNYQDIEVLTSLGPASNPIRFGKVQNTYFAGDVNLTLGLTTYTTIDEVDSVILEVDFLEGLFHIDSHGGSGPNWSTYRYRYREFGTVPWSGFTEIKLGAEVHAVAHSPSHIEFAARERYDIEVSFLEADETSTSRSKWAPYLHAVTEVIDVIQDYPDTAVLQFNITAMSNLQGALPNVQFHIEGLKVREGSFGASKTYTESPAWCLMDFMTNTRYGAAIPDSEISLASFITFSDYCASLVGIDTTGDGLQDTTEKRAILNYSLDTDKQPLDAFEEILNGTRGVLVKNEGLWKIKVARDDTPVQLVTWANTLRDSVILRYIRDVDAINVVESRFLNAAKNYENDLVVYPVIDDWPNSIRKLSTQYRGATRATQVLRESVFELRSRTLPKLSVEFGIALEGIVFEVMDIINFAYPRITDSIGGRVAQQYGTATNSVRQCIIDEDYTFAIGQSYILHLHSRRDEYITRIISPTLNGTTTRVILIEASEPDFPFTPIAPDARYAIGNIAETVVMPFRITNIQRRSDLALTIQGVHHVPAIYDDYIAFDETTITPTENAPYTPGSRPPPLTSLQAHHVFKYDNFESSNNGIVLEWDVAAIDSSATESFAPYGGVEIYLIYIRGGALLGSVEYGAIEFGGYGTSSDESDPKLLTTIRGTNIVSYRDPFPPKQGSWMYTVTPISTYGVSNIQGALSVVMDSTGGIFVPPDNITNGAVSSSTIEILWQDNEDPRLASTQMYRGLLANYSDSTFIANIPVGTETYTHTGLASFTTYYFRLANVQTNGLVGSFATFSTNTV